MNKAISFLPALFLCLAAPAFAQGAPAGNPAPAGTQAPADQGANGITQAAVQRGALNCAGRINQVTNFLGFGPQAGALLLPPPAQPDQRVVSVSMEVPADKAQAYISASFAPNQANGCGAVYDAVVYWPMKCEALAAKQFAGLAKAGILKKDIQVLDGGPATKIFLMPAGTGCVSIKKEVVL